MKKLHSVRGGDRAGRLSLMLAFGRRQRFLFLGGHHYRLLGAGACGDADIAQGYGGVIWGGGVDLGYVLVIRL